jgi:hypothetical protein
VSSRALGQIAIHAEMVPKILLFHTLQWPNAARLALAFRAAECQVHALCRSAHPVCRLSAVERIYPYRPFAPLWSLRAAIKAASPDLIIPCDDPAVSVMSRLYSQLRPTDQEMSAVIKRSFGKPAGYQIASVRSKLPSIAEHASVLIPRTSALLSLGELQRWLAQEGFPAVLKTDQSWGGSGVVVVRNLQEAEIAYRQMARLQRPARAIKRVGWDHEPDLLLRLIRAARPVLSVQKYVAGAPANSAVACWRGELLASIEVEALVTLTPTGNATVIRVLDNPAMITTVRRVVKWLGVPGFLGFDFVLEEGSGRPSLIEINPRATQINHLVAREETPSR